MYLKGSGNCRVIRCKLHNPDCIISQFASLFQEVRNFIMDHIGEGVCVVVDNNFMPFFTRQVAQVQISRLLPPSIFIWFIY